MQYVKLYTLKEEMVVTSSDRIEICSSIKQPIHISYSDDFIISATVDVVSVPVERYVNCVDIGYGESSCSEDLVAFDPKIRKLLMIDSDKLKGELKDLTSKHKELNREHEELKEYLSKVERSLTKSYSLLYTYENLSFWKRLLFLLFKKI
jgi:hypothetical protein